MKKNKNKTTAKRDGACVRRLVRADENQASDQTVSNEPLDPVEFLDNGQNEHLIIFQRNNYEIRLVSFRNGRYQKHRKFKVNKFGKLLLRWSGIKF